MLIIQSLLFCILSFASFEPPELTRPVMDQAGMLNPAEAQSLNQLLLKVYQSGGPQFAILTVESLNGASLFDASFKTVEKWKLGDEKRDDGLLIFIAKKEKKIRIEVGQGLEGDIPDIIAKRAIENIMSPRFKNGQFSEGIYLATLALLKKAVPELNLNGAETQLNKKEKSSSRPLLTMFMFLFFLVIIIFNPRLLFYYILLGGGRSSGGFGGGGFGGGGGGFSGGGASGGW